MSRHLPFETRFENSYIPEPNSGCWIWLGNLNPSGYGDIYGPDGKRRKAHRVSYLVRHGRLPLPGLVIDHLCRLRCCVNPDHLEVVTQAENVARGDGGQHWAAKTHCPAGHPYDQANTYVLSGHRHCRTCMNARRRARRARGEP